MITNHILHASTGELTVKLHKPKIVYMILSHNGNRVQ
jgi:hypothetical protein